MVVFCENYTEYTKAIAWANVVYCHCCLLLKLVLHIGSTLNVSVGELCYKLEGRGFDSRWGHWNFSVT
jgi:hypothetical protein